MSFVELTMNSREKNIVLSFEVERFNETVVFISLIMRCINYSSQYIFK